MSLHLLLTDPKCRRVFKNRAGQELAPCRSAKNMQHRTGAGLLHSDRCREHVESTCVKKPLHGKTDLFRSHIIDIRSHFENALPGFIGIADHCPNAVQTSEILRPYAISDLLRLHGRHTAEFSHEILDQCRTGRCAELSLNLSAVNRHIPEDLRRSRRRHRQDTMCALNRSGPYMDRRRADLIRGQLIHDIADRRDIHDRVHCSDFMKMNIRHRRAVHSAFRFRDHVVDIDDIRLDLDGKAQTVDNVRDFIKPCTVMVFAGFMRIMAAAVITGIPIISVIMRMTEMFFILRPGISSLLTFRPSSVPLFRVLVQKTDRLTGIRAHKLLLFPAVDADMHMRTLDPIPFDLLRINQRAGNSCVIQLPDNVVLLSFTEQFEQSSRQHIACSTHAQIQI